MESTKIKKPPSKYNVFMKETMEEFKTDDKYKDLDHKEKFTAAAGLWKTSDKNPANQEQNNDSTKKIQSEKKKKSIKKIQNESDDDDTKEIQNNPVKDVKEKKKKSVNKIENNDEVKEKKPPSKYNIYMKAKMAELKQDEENKDLKHILKIEIK